jgi:hypothetical protein
MFIAKKHLSRRTFLRGAGVTLGLPLLDAMIPAATALAQTAAKPAPRMGFVYIPHGAVMDRWSPKATGTTFEFTQILKPLEPFKDQLTIVSGLRNKPAESTSPHGIVAGTWLNCTAPAIGQNTKAGISADQLAVQRIGQDTPFPSLELTTEGGGPCDPSFGCGYGTTISFRTPTQPVPMEYNPRKVFYQLFGQGDTAEERKTIVNETRSILDAISLEAGTFQRRLGREDRTIVAEYLDSIREIERRIQTMEQRDVSSLNLPAAPVGVPNDFAEHLDLMFNLMALAYQANLTRVVTFMMAKEVSMRTFNNIGVPDAFHPLSHHGNNASNMDKLARVQTFLTECFARFVKKLASTKDGDGSVLDHSIILFGSNMSDSNRHNNDPLPSALLGRGYGRIKGGQHLRYPQDTPFANLLLTLLERGGIPVETIGNSTGLFPEV